MLIYKFCKISDISESDIIQTFELLSDAQKAYLNSLNETKRKQSFAVRTLLNRVLTANFDNISISNLYRDSKGKPTLAQSNLSISLTHSCEYVGCAVSDNAVGIDIERIKPIKPAVIDKVCSSEEIQTLNSEADFFTFWTLKEAYVKATGKTNCRFSEISLENDSKYNIITNEIDGYKYSILEINLKAALS